METLPPKSFRLGDLDLSALKDQEFQDTSHLTKPQRKGLFAEVFAVVWDQIADHADDGLRALADVARGVTSKAGPVVRLLGGVAAGLLDLAADRIDPDTP